MIYSFRLPQIFNYLGVKMMLVSRPYVQQRSSFRNTGIRPTLKIPSVIQQSETVEREYRSTSPFKNPIELSTPSPSAIASNKSSCNAVRTILKSAHKL